MKNQNRRKFFRNITLSAIGVSLLSTFPAKLFAAKKVELKNTSSRVKIHNKAVKRSR